MNLRWVSCVDCDDFGGNVREVSGTENVIGNAIISLHSFLFCLFSEHYCGQKCGQGGRFS